MIGSKMQDPELSIPEADMYNGRVKENIAKLRDIEIIPCKSGKWVSISSQPLIADDKPLERLFQDKPEVSFVDSGEKLKRAAGKKNLRGVKGLCINWWVHCG